MDALVNFLIGHMTSFNMAPEISRNQALLRVLSGSVSFWPLQWRHNEHDSVSNHQPHDCLLNRLFRRRSKKKSKLRVTGLCAGISPGTGEFPAQMASNAENVSIWWRHHASGYTRSEVVLCHAALKCVLTHLPLVIMAAISLTISRCIFVNEMLYSLIRISLRFVPKGPIDNNPGLV